MRSRSTLVILVGAVVLMVAGIPRPAAAVPGAPHVGFGVHGDFTLSDLPGPAIVGTAGLKDAYGPGVGGGAHLDLGFVGLGLRLSGDRFRSSYATVFGPGASRLGVDGGRLSIAALRAGAKVPVFALPVVSPYVTGGVGLAWLSVGETRTLIDGAVVNRFASSRQDARRSVDLGAGVDLKVGVKLYVEARYVWVLTPGERSTYVPVSLGVTF